MAGRRMKMNPNFGKQAADPGEVSDAVLQNARRSGQLNISNRGLTDIPLSVWNINEMPTSSRRDTLSFTDGDAERWWEGTELTKLTAASNRIHYISEKVGQLRCLVTLDLYDNEIEVLPPSIGDLQELKHLNVSVNRLRSLPDTIAQCRSLISLDCHRNAVDALPRSIGELSSLEMLDLSENRLQELPDTFCQLRRLRQFRAKLNKIKCLPESIAYLTALQLFDVSSNKLEFIPQSIGELSRLEILDVKQNLLSECPRLSNCSDLKELYLGENSITSFDPSICRLPNLMTLDVHYNKISQVPNAITTMETLIRLDLGNNDITGLPYEIGLMTNLATLVLDGNPLRSIRRDIINRGTEAVKKYLVSRMKEDTVNDGPKVTVKEGVGRFGDGEDEVDPFEVGRTQTLDLCEKELTNIPLDVWKSIHGKPVKSVLLKRNRLSTVPAEIFGFGDSLTALDLSVNRLTCIPSEIGMLMKLQHLDLGGNRISSLPDSIHNLSLLLHIDLSLNSFAEVPSVVYTLASLQDLMLGSNDIKEVDVHALLKMSTLRTLDLQNNSIMNLPPELGLCEQLNCLKLDGNRFRVPRPALLAKGTVAILQYLRGRIQE